MRILYLHGFASGPRSRKATFFRDRLERLGFHVEVPELDQGDFRRLTISRQLRLVETILARRPAILIGSSLGGYLAALYAARHPEIGRLILLAPAFSFYSLWMSEVNASQLAQWKQNGTVEVFHYASCGDQPIGYGLMEDAQQYEPYPDVRQPTLVFHGNRDASVPVEYSVEFARSRPNVNLVLLSSGHELTDVLDGIWERAREFLPASDV